MGTATLRRRVESLAAEVQALLDQEPDPLADDEARADAILAGDEVYQQAARVLAEFQERKDAAEAEALLLAERGMWAEADEVFARGIPWPSDRTELELARLVMDRYLIALCEVQGRRLPRRWWEEYERRMQVQPEPEPAAQVPEVKPRWQEPLAEDWRDRDRDTWTPAQWQIHFAEQRELRGPKRKTNQERLELMRQGFDPDRYRTPEEIALDQAALKALQEHG